MLFRPLFFDVVVYGHSWHSTVVGGGNKIKNKIDKNNFIFLSEDVVFFFSNLVRGKSMSLAVKILLHVSHFVSFAYMSV